tara:strand:+ start:724 stop:1707 length:984 start_codon:yes stop_codon:yes gene_type:complete
MIKEYIEVLDNLRPEETRFDFDPLNKNLCFGGASSGGGNPLENLLNSWGIGGGGGSSSGDVETEGGLSPQDQEMKDLLYGKIKGMFDRPYSPYEGGMYQPREEGELALLEELKGGGDYQKHYDTAATDLGFTQDIYKKGTEYGVGDLDRDAGDLMSSDTYRNEVAERILRDMNRGASMSGMDLTGKQNFGGTGGGDRADLARLSSNLGYSEKAGDALSNLHYGALKDARSSARQLQQDRLGAAGLYEGTALEKLGVGTRGLDKRYSTSLGAYGEDRAFGDRGLAYDKKMWDERQNYPLKQLAFGSGLFSGMPFEEKVVSNQPASGGK